MSRKPAMRRDDLEAKADARARAEDTPALIDLTDGTILGRVIVMPAAAAARDRAGWVDAEDSLELVRVRSSR